MKNIKRLVLVLVSTLSMALLTGCSSTTETENVIGVKVSTPDGLPTISMAKLIKEKPSMDENYSIEYSIEKTSETLSTSVMKEEPDIAIVPSNMASIAYNKTDNYVIAGTTGFGSSYLVSTEDISKYGDLTDQTILNIGKGLTPDITAQYIMKERGLDVESLDLSYVNSPSELVPMIVSGKESVAIVPEPALSAMMTKAENVEIFKSLNDEYKEVANSEYGYPQATLIVKKDFLENNEEFVNEFIDEVEKSVVWANENPKELSDYCEEIEVSTEKPMIEKSIERANLNFVSIDKNKNDYISYYQKLSDYNPQSLGGSAPDEEIFMDR